MITSGIVTILMLLMFITGSLSSPTRPTTLEDFGVTSTTDGNHPVPESPGIKNRTLYNSGWQSSDGEFQSVTSAVFGDRPTIEPDSILGTTDDFLGLRDSTKSPREWTDTTTSLWGTTTTAKSLDFTTTTMSSTTLSSQGGSRHKSCRMVPSPGECQAAFPRYFFNESTSQCDCYIFGGCDEGEGSYRSLEECQQKCLPENREEGPSCKLVYINFKPDHSTTTTRTTVPDSNFVNNGASWPTNMTSFRNNSHGNFNSSAQNFPRSPNNHIGFSNASNVSSTSFSQSPPNIWSSNTSKATQSPSLETEEPLPLKCKVFSERGICVNGSPRYYYNHTSSQCNCYNYTVCGETESFSTLEECVQTCNPILKNQGPSCPVPPIRRSRPTSSFGNSTIPGSDLISANGTIGGSTTSSDWQANSNRTKFFKG